MQLREALIAQAPSLELQRAAYSEICRLDAKIKEAVALLDEAWDLAPKSMESVISNIQHVLEN